MTKHKAHLENTWYVFLVSMNNITLQNGTHSEVRISEAKQISTTSINETVVMCVMH